MHPEANKSKERRGLVAVGESSEEETPQLSAPPESVYTRVQYWSVAQLPKYRHYCNFSGFCSAQALAARTVEVSPPAYRLARV